MMDGLVLEAELSEFCVLLHSVEDTSVPGATTRVGNGPGHDHNRDVPGSSMNLAES